MQTERPSTKRPQLPTQNADDYEVTPKEKTIEEHRCLYFRKLQRRLKRRDTPYEAVPATLGEAAARLARIGIHEI
jgi:hypothetical protein